MSESDHELITRVLRNDDRHAFGELVKRHQSPLRSMLRKLTCGDKALADDLAQETFVQAFLKLSTFRGDARLRGGHSGVYRLDAAVTTHGVGSAVDVVGGSLPLSVHTHRKDVRGASGVTQAARAASAPCGAL